MGQRPAGFPVPRLAPRLVETQLDAYRRLLRQSTTQGRALLSFARVAVSQGELAVARARYQESLALAREIDAKNLIASALEGGGAVAAAQREPGWAARLWGAAQALRGAIGAPLPPVYRADYERTLAVPYGTVLWLDTTEPLATTPLRRAVMAQDTGSAIAGAVRIDYFWGWGAQAEAQEITADTIIAQVIKTTPVPSV